MLTTAHYLSSHYIRQVATLSQGTYFGEGLLISQPRSNTVQASTFCDLFSLTRSALEEVRGRRWDS